MSVDDTAKDGQCKGRAPFRRDLMDQCKLWQKKSANANEGQPIHNDTPTLILTGRYDDRTPTELAKRILGCKATTLG